MSPEPRGITALRPRLEALTERGRALEVEGLPFPTDSIRDSFLEAATEGDVTTATDVLKRGEALLTHASTDWVWVRELLRRADELRAVAGAIGVDLAVLDTRVGNPRRHLLAEPLSAASLEKAAASASLALAVLNDAVPKFCIQEAQALGVSIRRARDRGEDVAEAARSFARLLAAIQDQNLPTAAQRLVETRRTVARIPRAPALPPLSPREEEEILLEARNLARRLQRIKGKARDATSAARLMTQVRAAISEDRRYGTPEEEIEQLWAEVDRLTQEKRKGAAPVTTPEVEEAPAPEEATESNGTEPHERTVRPSFYVPYVPPDERPADPGAEPNPDSSSTGRGRNRPRPRA